MKSGEKRTYRMTARREAVEETRERILQAVYDLWLDLPYDEITIEAIAERADVSRPTIFRHFGPREAVFAAAVPWAAERARTTLWAIEPTDPASAVSALVAAYEVMGDANLRTLELEGRIDTVDAMLQAGRDGHTAWVQTAFAGALPSDGPERDHLVKALYAATDVHVWKLFRRDFGLSVPETEALIRTLVEGALDRGKEDR